MTDNTMQQTEQDESRLTLQFLEMGAIQMPPSPGRRKHLSPAPLVARNSPEIKVRSDQLTCRILRGLLDEKKYTRQMGHHQAEYTLTLPKGRGYVNIILSPLD